MEGNSKGWPRLDPFHEMLVEERKRLAFRPTRMQKIVFKNAMTIEKELMNARRYDHAIRLES